MSNFVVGGETRTDCDLASILDESELLSLRLDHKGDGVADIGVTHFVLTKELAVKMHEQLTELLKITRH